MPAIGRVRLQNPESRNRFSREALVQDGSLREFGTSGLEGLRNSMSPDDLESGDAGSGPKLQSLPGHLANATLVLLANRRHLRLVGEHPRAQPEDHPRSMVRARMRGRPSVKPAPDATP